MANDFLAAQSRAVLAAYAGGMGVPESAFESGELLIAERPAPAPWPYLALAVSCPGGTVLSVAPDLVTAAEDLRPARPNQAVRPEFLRRMTVVAEQSGRRTHLDGPNISWALGRTPDAPALPADLRFELKDAAWMNELLGPGEFPNGVGEPGPMSREVRNRYAVAILDAADQPVAIAGAFYTFGLTEVGIDVVPGRQGEGLGVAAVVAVTREILARGETPLYGCATDNIRSQRTAWAAGFVPLFADAVIDG
ncbi:MAG: GNAT family N-acetyltransferase [Dehalococcoidia bacterium]